MNRPCDLRRWRWVTDKERLLTQEGRDKSHLHRYWVTVMDRKPPKGSRINKGWWVEAELMNGQRVFYRSC